MFNKIYFLIIIIAVISNNFNRLEPNSRNQLETLTHKDKLVIKIDKTDAETMKQVVIFMYTAKCELNESNCKFFANKLNITIKFTFFLAYSLLDAAGRYDIKDLKVHTGRCKYINSSFFCLKIIFKKIFSSFKSY